MKTSSVFSSLIGFAVLLTMCSGDAAAADVSSPVGEGMCVAFTGAVDPRAPVAASVEAVGGYCSLSGCVLSGALGVNQGTTGRWPIRIYNFSSADPRGLCLYWQSNGTCAIGLTYKVSDGAMHACNGDACTVDAPFSAVSLTASNGTITSRSASAGFGFGSVGSQYFGMTAGTNTVDFTNGGQLHFAATSLLKFDGDSTVSLPTCNAAAEGKTDYDTTVKDQAVCSGLSLPAGTSAWRYQRRTSNTLPNLYWGHYGEFFKNGVAAEGANFAKTTKANLSYDPIPTFGNVQVSCWWETAGVGGSTGVVVEVTDGTTTINGTLGSCTTAAFTTLSVAIGTGGSQLAVGDLNLQLKTTTDCGTNPSNIHCGIDLQWVDR